MTDLYIGLMSGTSVDGLDIALCRFQSKPEIIAVGEFPFPESLRRRINLASENLPILLDGFLELESDYTQFCARATASFIAQQTKPEYVRAIGFHGQTLRHRPDLKSSLQMANPSLLAEQTGVDVVADFRRRDLAAGGEGAPLVPAFHRYLVEGFERPLALLNLGGIANLTLFDESGKVIGFDSGPANTLMDQWIGRHQGLNFDQDGAWAETGSVNAALLTELLQEPYFERAAPKSTGRELFNLDWLDDKLTRYPSIAAQDIQRTLLELTAQSVTAAIAAPLKTLVLCGGGAKNRLLVERIRMLMPETELKLSDELGWPSSHLEAVAFAWLARQHVEGLPGNIPEVTGANGSRILGAYYPR